MHVIVHGGAGPSPEDPDERAVVLEAAARAGGPADDPLDAVEAAVRTLEASPRFNAGIGSAVQSDGGLRTDAGLMTSDRQVGAACSMPGVCHAVSVARIVAEETPHVLVSGEHAVALAEAFGVPVGVDLLTEENRTRFETADPPGDGVRTQLDWLADRFGPEEFEGDTVGAVAHHEGRFAAATSTGGRWFALAGRVGDVPLVGGGFYATPAGAVSATGNGEEIATEALARRTVQLIDAGEGAESACNRAIREFDERTGSTAGVIAIDAADRAGSAHNASMDTATFGP